jgi:hypothetical protein
MFTHRYYYYCYLLLECILLYKSRVVFASHYSVSCPWTTTGTFELKAHHVMSSLSIFDIK